MTEPEYFSAQRLEARNRLIEIVIADQGGAPKTLVERAALRKKQAERDARRAKDDNLKYDEVWCVFDVDDHPNLPDAKQQARDNGIEIALSNPSFELWLLLHFADQTAHINRTQVLSRLKEHIKSYDKHIPSSLLRGTYIEAVRRAQQLERRHVENGMPDCNPSTSVYRLTERINNLRTNEQ